MVAKSTPALANVKFHRLLKRGEERLLDGDGLKALAVLEKALTLRPGDLMALGLRASALLDLERVDEAVVAFSELIERAPDAPAGYLGRAGALSELQKARGTDALGPTGVETALADFAAAYRLDAEPEGREVIHFLRGCLLEQLGEFSKAAEDFEAAAGLRPNAAAYLVHLGNARAQAGDLEGGAAVIQTMVAMLEQTDDGGSDLTPPAASPHRPPSRA